MERKGIETEYKGRIYRSKLEARWAAFFDLIGFTYDYEPFELNGWIPDFILYGKKCNILVEIKPEIYQTEDVFMKISKAIELDGVSADGDYQFNTIAIVMSNQFKSDGWMIPAGLLIMPRNERDRLYWKNKQSGTFDFSSYMYLWDGLMFDDIDYRKWFLTDDDPDYDKLKFLWQEAGNKVRYLHIGV
jgi:hypothetical protein